MRFLRSLCALCASAALCACASNALQGPAPTPPPSDSPIKHVVIIIQENRSVDNLFNGFPGADTVTRGQTHTGAFVNLRPISLANSNRPCHSHLCWVQEYDNGRNDGFDLENPPGTRPDFDYAFVPQSETKPYWAMAQTYAFADRMFQSNTGPSYPAHQYLIAGQSDFAAENPDDFGRGIWGCDAPPRTTVAVLGSDGQEHPGPYPCYSYQTLADEMDAAGITWHYYAPAFGADLGYTWSAYDAISQIRRGKDWTLDVISPETQVLSDIAAGQLSAVTWVVPKDQNSDHAGSQSTMGPQWVASVVNAVGNSSYWNNTAILIMWDDWGGWYDHLNGPQLDLMGLGFRVPLIVVSPYTKAGYVSHVQHEFGSIMRFTEERFGLSPLTQVDGRADDLADMFDFTKPPRAFVPIPTTLAPSFFELQPQSSEPPDEY